MKIRKITNFIFLWFFLTIVCIMLAGASNVSAFEDYNSGGKRDPFVSLVVESSQLDSYSGLKGVKTVNDIQIQGLVIDKVSGSYIIANGIVLLEGEMQDGVRVVEIEPSGILFDIHGRKEFKRFLDQEDLQ